MGQDRVQGGGGQGQFGEAEPRLGAGNGGVWGGCPGVYGVQSPSCMGEVRKEAVGLLPPKSS